MTDPLHKLDDTIRKLKSVAEQDAKGSEISQYSIAMRMSIELLAGVIVGALIGYSVDRWLATTPWCLVAGVFLGFAAGILNMKRSMDALDKQSK